MNAIAEVDEITEEWRTLRNPNIFMLRATSELEYALQPIADINTGEVYGYEALLRNFQALDCKTPVEVFDFAHDIGCLPRLDLVLRAKAIEKFAQIPGAKSFKLFFNMDCRLIAGDAMLLQETEQLLMQYGLSTSNFCIEVPENDNSVTIEQIGRFVSTVRTLGFPFAIDDFGEGYSQLKLLYEYEPQILKIDRFFVSSIQKDAKKRLFVASLVDLAHVMGMRIVAEGVETPAELHACREVGCDLVQGYLLARPTPDVAQILSAYPVVIKHKDRRNSATGADAALVQQKIEPLLSIGEHATIDEALGIFRDSLQTVIPVTNVSGEPIGILRERDFKPFLYMPYGRDLLRNRNFDNSIRRYVVWCPSADVNARLDRLIDMTTDGLDDGLVVTCEGRYCGFLSTAALLNIANEMRVRVAEDMNPLSKLPGNVIISSYVASMAAEPDVGRCFCSIDIDNFKPFNDTYGFRIGDRALMLLAELLKRELTGANIFLGHVGGDDFFVGARDMCADEFSKRVCSLRDRFASEAESFYEPHHRRQGFVLAQDREGRSRRFPLLSCSVAILSLPAGGAISDGDLLSRHIAAVKHEAKEHPRGVVVRELDAQGAVVSSAGCLCNG